MRHKILDMFCSTCLLFGLTGVSYASCPPCHKEVCSGIPGIACACIPIPGCGASIGCGLGDKVKLVLINKTDLTVRYNFDGVQASLGPFMQTFWDTCRKLGEGVAKRNISFDADLTPAYLSKSYTLELCPVATPGVACSYSFKKAGPNFLEVYRD